MEHILLNLEQAFISHPALGPLFAFVAGFLVSFSPCIYPLIPITLGVVGATSASSKIKSFVLSFVFVLGICVTYTVIGVMAALMGKMFNTFFINPAAYFVLGLVLFFFGLAMFDVVKIGFLVPVFNNIKAQKFSIFFMGMLGAFALLPCNFPVLGAILTLIAKKRDVVYGAVCLFCFALGYGSILIALGTFTGLINKLPKQGSWLIIIKRFLGIVLLCIGGYFFYRFMILAVK